MFFITLKIQHQEYDTRAEDKTAAYGAVLTEGSVSSRGTSSPPPSQLDSKVNSLRVTYYPNMRYQAIT